LPEEIVNSVDARDFHRSTDSEEDQAKYVPSAEIIEMQQKMSELLQRQLEKGGVIDLEAERNKYLIPKVIAVTFCHSGSSFCSDWTSEVSLYQKSSIHRVSEKKHALILLAIS